MDMIIPFPNKKYQIIYADPPWPEKGGGKIKRGADRHYKLMSVKEIIELPIKEITADNSHLYLWVTNNYLESGLIVMKEWGFKYKTMITWVKDRFGLGQYYRGQTEHCLFGIKGFVPYKISDGKRQQGVTYFIAKRNVHSKKPIEMKKFIEKVSDREGFNKIELFARPPKDRLFEDESYRGWDVWGNEP